MGDLHLKSLATYAGNHQMAVDDSAGGRHLAQEVLVCVCEREREFVCVCVREFVCVCV